MPSKFCSRHGLYQGRCPGCYREDNARRAAKQRASGRTTAAWQRLKREAKEAAGYQCQACGRPEVRTADGWLDVHLRDEYRHLSHAHVTSSQQLTVTCKPCHGRHHQPESLRGRYVT